MYGDSETIVRLLRLFDVVKLNSGKKNNVLILIAMKILDFTHQIWIQLIVISATCANYKEYFGREFQSFIIFRI